MLPVYLTFVKGVDYHRHKASLKTVICSHLCFIVMNWKILNREMVCYQYISVGEEFLKQETLSFLPRNHVKNPGVELCQLPREKSNQQSYPAVKSIDYKADQHDKMSSRVLELHFYLGGKQQLSS